MESGNRRKYQWFAATMIFILAAVSFLALILWNPLVGLAVLVLALLVFFVGCVLRSYFMGKRPDDSQKADFVLPLKKKDLKNAQNLLRYATAILAFLSLTTTAKGMKSFVFDTDWMAYLGSFAIQSILVVFSLLLCRFFVQVTVLAWADYLKRLAEEMMILFFCMTLALSSVFSFSYIANSAYKDTWVSDSETIIHDLLLEEAYNLQEENNRRGKVLLDDISGTAKEKLEGAIIVSKSDKTEKLRQDLNDLINKLNIQTESSGQVDIDKEELLETYPRYAKDINSLYSEYEKKYKKVFEEQIDSYNGVVNELMSWQLEELAYSEMKKRSEDNQKKLQTIIKNLESLKTNISGWRNHNLDKAISAYRSGFCTICDNIKIKCENLVETVAEIETTAENIENEEQDKNLDELNEILSDIYLLGIDKNSKVDDLMKKVNNLAIDASKNDDFSSEIIQDIISLRNAMMLYDNYLELQEQLDTYIKNNLTIIYQLDKGDEAAEQRWNNARNNDFNTLFVYINSLPNVSAYDAPDSISPSYDSDEIREKISIVQRDLLGNLTDFEKAFNYFKYEFRVMAYFSALVAVYFDLGAFLVGCFLYLSEYFDVKEDDSKKESEEM